MTGPAEPLDWRVDELERTLTDLTGLLTGLDAAVKALTARIDPPPAKGSHPSRWAWQHATQDQAAWLWAGLVPWVRWATDRYPTQLRDLTPCWHQHGDAVEELTALWAAWREAYHGTDRDRSDLAHWHDRWLPGATNRLVGPHGILTTCAHAKTHRPPNTTGAPRHHFDHTGTPTIEEHAATDTTNRPRNPETRPAG